MAGMGHEDAFPRPRLSARCRFSQGTFAGTGATGETRRKRPRSFRLNASGFDPNAVVNKPAIQIGKGPVTGAPVSLISAGSAAKIPFDPIVPDPRCSREQIRMDQEGK